MIEKGNKPLVSAVVLCYNQDRYVRETLDSIAAQTYPNLELIICDDCSCDQSVRAIENWITSATIPARLIKHSSNRGICRSLNDLISAARGDYIAIVAADDVWMPDKTAIQVAAMNCASPEVGVVYSDAFQMDEAGQRLPQRFIEAHRNFVQRPFGDIKCDLWEGNFIPAMSTLVRRKCYDKVGLYDETLSFEDWDMWLRISEKFHFIYLDQTLASYRILPTSMTRASRSKVLDSTLRIYLRGLRSGTMPSAMRSNALLRVRWYLRDLYFGGYPNVASTAWETVRTTLSSDAVAVLAFSSLGIPAPWVRGLKRSLGLSRARAERTP